MTVRTAVTIAVTVIGVTLGLVSGFVAPVDAVLMRITDIFLAFPRLVLALAFVAALGPGIQNAIIAIAITSWPPYARLARAETLTVRNSDFIAATRLQGASSARIIWKHIVPLCMSSVIIRVTLDMAGIILTAAGLTIFTSHLSASGAGGIGAGITLSQRCYERSGWRSSNEIRR